MHYKIKKMFLAAALAVASICAGFPAFADEPAKDVIVAAEDVAVAAKNAIVAAEDAAVAAEDVMVATEDDAVTAKDDSVAVKDDADTAEDVALVGKDVTVVAEDVPSQQESPQETSGGQASHKGQATVFPKEDDSNQGPGAEKEDDAPPEPEKVSLGRFSVTGYCGCEQCSSGHNLTYSGAVPTPAHTLSADLSLFPLGTKLEIDGTVYTVEDKGSSVNGNILDIFYATHEEALAKGTYTTEVFLVQDN